MIGEKTVIAGACILVGDVHLDRFTGGDAVDNTRTPLNSVVFLSLAAVRAAGFSEFHGGFDECVVHHQSRWHSLDHRPNKRAVTGPAEGDTQGFTKTHVHGATGRGPAGPFRRCSRIVGFNASGEESSFDDLGVGVAHAVQ